MTGSSRKNLRKFDIQSQNEEGRKDDDAYYAIRRKLVVRSYGSNMAAAEAKLSFDLAVDSVLDSLEPKFILKV